MPQEAPHNNSNNDSLKLSHLDKVFFPKAKITKSNLIDYYRNTSSLILPYIKNRPHSLLRHPNGINGPSFFQKDIEKPPAFIKTETIFSESNNADIHYFVTTDEQSLLYMVQLGCIEINPWNSTTKHLDKPDWFVMDLDPEGIGFDKVIETAKVVRKIFDDLNIPSYPKTSGKTGIHIYVPLAAKYTYDQAKTFAEIIANKVNEQLPKTTSVLRMPSKRKHRIYIDFLQNRKGQTLAAPYSVRPTPEATVSTPLEWKEINKSLKPTNFTIKNIQKRLDKVGDLWQPVIGKGIDLKKIIVDL